MACDLQSLTELDGSDPAQWTAVLQDCTALLQDPRLWLWTSVLTVVGALIGALIGRYKRAVLRDTLLGAALGPLGWIVSLCLPRSPLPRICPDCAQPAAASDRHCRHCGRRLDAE
jgi:hypothetical protein